MSHARESIRRFDADAKQSIVDNIINTSASRCGQPTGKLLLLLTKKNWTRFATGFARSAWT